MHEKLLAALQRSQLSHFISKSNHLLIAGLQILHVFGLILLLGPLILLVLRVVGLVLREQPIDYIVGQCRALSSIGLTLSLASGALMFTAAPLHYYANWAFDAKMVVLLAALLSHALLFAWRSTTMQMHATLAKLHAVVSAALWVLVCMGGRAIGFV